MKVTRREMLEPAVALGAAAAGVGVLLFRPPTVLGVLVGMLAVGVIGWLAPVPERWAQPAPRGAWGAATAVGAGAFVAARLLRPPFPMPVTVATVAVAVVASVSEEAFFRRFLYGWLISAGPSVAVGGSAALFALVHLPSYGPAALPVDLAAGLLLGWQRWATGSWTSPALTHLLANLVQLA